MKKTILILTAIFFTATIFSSCNELKKMVKKASEVSYKTVPAPLEMHANKVAINVSVTFPPKYFGKKVKLVITPTISADEGNAEKEFPTQTIQGEKFQDSYPAISYKEGGTYRFKDTIEYDPALRMSDLNLKFQLSDQKRRSADLVAVKLTDGIITTPELVEKGIAVDNGYSNGNTFGQAVVVPIQKPSVSYNTQIARIYFAIQKDRVRKGEMDKEEINDLIQYIKLTSTDPNQELASLSIAGYASPDGPFGMNENLVKNRGSNSRKALGEKLKKENIENVNLDALMITQTTPAEDWEGFKELVENSNIADKNLILRVLSMYPDGETREREIKNMAAVYDELRNSILPLLRRSIIKLEYKGREKQTSEIVRFGASSPNSLSKEELLFAAYKTEDLDVQEKVYKSYLKKYPQDWKALNNLAATLAKNGNFNEAKVNFQKVLNLQSDNPAALNNLGAIAMGEKDWDTAWDYFVRAENAGCRSAALPYNMGVILIMRGQYAEAVNKLSGTSFNKALAQTLNGDNESAISTLNSMNKSNAIFYYLKAVTAAKAGKEGDVYENLRIAVSKDASLKEYAANDLEFRNYFDVQDFKTIVK